METKAQHIMVDMWLDSPLTEEHLALLKSEVDQNLTVVHKLEHKFEPEGETIVWILAESHFAVHTYPEHQYLSFDIYICNLEVDIQGLVDRLEKKLPVKFMDRRFTYRGHKYLNTAVSDHDQNRLSLFKLPMESRQASLVLLAFTTVVATCSLLYELLLAQTLATTMGNTVLRYNVTIGLYIASMGLGALCYPRLIQRWRARNERGDEVGFVWIEVLLSVIGFLSPMIVLMVDSLFQRTSVYQGWFAQSFMFSFNHLLIVLIGFISGLELPLLMDMAKKIHPLLGRRVLGFDYLGTLIAAVSFPILLVPYFNLFTIAAMVALLNGLVALLFVFYRKVGGVAGLTLLGISLVANLLYLFNHKSMNQWIIDQFYFLGRF